MQKANVKTKIVYSLKIFIQLQIRGIHPICSMPNPHNEKFTCWVYQATNEFIKAFDEIVSEAE